MYWTVTYFLASNTMASSAVIGQREKIIVPPLVSLRLLVSSLLWYLNPKSGTNKQSCFQQLYIVSTISCTPGNISEFHLATLKLKILMHSEPEKRTHKKDHCLSNNNNRFFTMEKSVEVGGGPASTIECFLQRNNVNIRDVVTNPVRNAARAFSLSVVYDTQRPVPHVVADHL